VRDGGSHGESAILYRSNAQSRAFEKRCWPNRSIPRLRRNALLRAGRDQGHAGLPAAGRQSRRRRGVRACGQHPGPRHRRAHAGRSPPARARGSGVTVGSLDPGRTGNDAGARVRATR
jgi:hypothetical protein